jgi:hypothetical protein
MYTSVIKDLILLLYLKQKTFAGQSMPHEGFSLLMSIHLQNNLNILFVGLRYA